MRNTLLLNEYADQLRRVDLLAGLSQELIELLAASSTQFSLRPGEILFAEGDPGDAVYAVVEGAVQIFVRSLTGKELVLAALRKGELIGEHYLFQGEEARRRDASARAGERTVLLRIEGSAFLDALAGDPALSRRLRARRDQREVDNLGKRSDMFRLLRSLGAVDPQASERFEAGEIIFHEGDEADAAWLITAGDVTVYNEARPEAPLARLGVGQCFGERACITDAPRAATVRALTPVEAIRISREHFVRLHELSPQLREIVAGLDFVYHLPQRGVALQYLGSRGGEGTVERLYRLADGRCFLASWVPALKALRLERVDPPDHPCDSLREVVWAEDAIGAAGRRRSVRFSADGLIEHFSAIGDWPEMPRIIEAAIDAEPFSAETVAAFARTGRLGGATTGEKEQFACFCMQITTDALEDLIKAGYDSFESLRQRTGCGTICGGCEPQIQSMLGHAEWIPVVASSQEQTADVRSIVLKTIGTASIEWRAGQYVVVSGRMGPHWVNRSYTIIAAAGPGQDIEIAVKREPQGLFSRWLFDGELADKELRISPPRGDCVWRPDPRPAVCLVAGIGVTPALAIVRSRRLHGAAGALHIDYSGRAAESMAFLAELQSAVAADANISLRPRFTSAGDRLDSAAVLDVVRRMPEADFFVCGPHAYMDQIVSVLHAANVPPERIHEERFAHAGAPPKADDEPRPPSAAMLHPGPASAAKATGDDRYDVTPRRTLIHRATNALPPAWRERVAERYLRRAEAPGPAAEHAVQYLLSAASGQAAGEATIAERADNFYSRQYRQFFNPVMGAFAMTAPRVLLASGSPPQGHLWRRRRETCAAMIEETHGAAPVMVIDRETAAVPLLLPRLDDAEAQSMMDWLDEHGAMPTAYRKLVEGEEVHCATPHAAARERSRDGALLEVIDCAIRSERLALLALHPHDPDAMGLHITLFAVEVVTPQRLETEYDLPPGALASWRQAALQNDRQLLFCVGVTEEVFTQCSQNLFVKRPAPASVRHVRAAWPNAWTPAIPLGRLLAAQFETLQVTVSAGGVPGASPRNGDLGKAAFFETRGRRSYLLIPYYPGNAVHGHAAKLWSNGYSTVVICDDHSALTLVTISGPSRVVTNENVRRAFPGVAGKLNQRAASNPTYWFVQEVSEIIQQRESLAANSLDPARPTCSINAGGEGRHDKKVAYFATNTLPEYDQGLQHKRESAGRSTDPAGARRHEWSMEVESALNSRRSHLRRIVEKEPAS